MAAELASAAGGAGRGRALTAVPRPERIPLSYAQQRMWFLNRFDPEAATYNLPIALRVNGALDVPALRNALYDLVSRHEVLRTLYPEHEGVGCQVVLPADDPAAQPALRLVEVTEADVAQVVSEVAFAPFDVTVAPPLRLRLLRLAEDDHVLVCVVHHIAGDGFSGGPLTRDLMTAYFGRLQGQEPQWAPLPVQYADYTLWQREVLGDEHDPTSLLARQFDYWRSALDGLPDQLELPTDRPRPPVSTGRGDTVAFQIDPHVHAALNRIAQQHNATLFMVLHAALAVLLARLSGTRDIAIGTPIAGRGEAALDDLIGMFVNTLVLRAEVDPGWSFSELLTAVRGTDLSAFEHADAPFERIVELLDPPRSQARHPLFQVSMTLQNLTPARLELPDVQVTDVDLSVPVTKFDLDLSMIERVTADGVVHGISGALTYATDLFDAATVELFVQRFARLLVGIASHPERPVGDQPLLAADEYAQLTRVPAAVGSGTLFPDLLTRGVRFGRDREAVRWQGRSYTYGELDDYSSRLARLLIGRGIGPESTVALAIGRSFEMTAAVWAVAKSGAAYVPVDPGYPGDRIRHMVTDSAASLGLTVTGHLDDLPEGIDWLALDEPAVAEYCAALPAGAITDADRIEPLRLRHTAYVIYTSGSTGLPKGVAVTHAGLAALAEYAVPLCGVEPGHRFLHVCSPSFDQSVEEWLYTFNSGATLIIVPPGVVGGTELGDLLRSERVTHTMITPAMLGTVDPAGLDALEVVATGGDATSPELLARWQPGRRYFNSYGPTEVTISSTFANLVPGRRVTIGGPVPGIGAFVLDDRLNPVPPTVPGELYLSGEALARGYRNRAGLTAERFVAGPWGEPGTRMYRTGDLVRWVPAADRVGRWELEYLGRTDFQVKIRGFRIELGEIDAVLAAADEVEFAVTLGRENAAGVTMLVSYVVPAPGRVIDETRLLADAARALPSYMVPSALVVLDAVPLTPVGKLDRRALPEPVLAQREYRAPANALEEVIAGVFGELLGADRVGRDDDFFELGGNSLTATQLVARLGAALDTRVPVRTVFEASTVIALEQVLRSQVGIGGRPAITVRPRPERIPLSFTQQRMWFVNQLDTDSGSYNMPIVLRLTGELRVDALRQAVIDVVSRHETLRTVYPEHEGVPHQVVLPVDAAVPAFEPETIESAALADRVLGELIGGFDVSTQVPLRAKLFRISDADPGDGPVHAVMFVTHHINADGWSMGPLARDIMVAYLARVEGDAPGWQPLPVQYADYALWQREVLGAESDPDSLIAAQAAYWRTALAGMPEELNLPVDRPRGSAPAAGGGMVGFTVDTDIHRGLVALAKQHNATLFMVVHAALAIFLARMAGTDDVAVGTTVAGRGEAELDDMVGMFVNTLVLRTPVPGQRSFAEVLADVKDRDLQAFAHGEMPFERLVELVNPVRSTARHPLFQVMLAFQNVPDQSFELPGLRVEAVDLGAQTSRFDLSLALTEVDSAEVGMTGTFSFLRSLFDEHTVEQFARRFTRLLAAIVGDPDLPVGELPLLSDDERRELVATAPAPATTALLPDLLTRGLRVGPDRVAVRDAGRSFTYAEIDDYSTRLARILISRGIGPEHFVAVALPRSLWTVVVVQAVAKTGGAHVPMDPAHATDRVKHMVAESGVRIGITLREHLPALPSEVDWLVLDHHATDRLCAAQSAEPITDADRRTPLRLQHPAYLIFTSGSTGLPKAVSVTHAGLGSLVEHAIDRYGLRAEHRMLQVRTPIADPSVLEWMAALAVGATLVVVPADIYGGEELHDLIRAERVTHALIPPALLGTMNPEGLADLTVVHVGGDVTTPELLAAWQPGRTYLNAYGPTEATIVSTYAELTAGQRVTIGRPVPGTTALVLDSRLNPVAPGVVGELYLSGPALARGYHNRPELTAERFVADPWGTPGARMYRTGDLVRWVPGATGAESPSGALELDYVGRSDFQVKVRGFRVELGEIDAALCRHESVDRAVTIGRADESGATILVSYVVPVAGAALDPNQLTEFVSRGLAPYMVPRAIVVLDALPLTPIGKLDRRALPEPVLTTQAYRAPATALEETVATAYAEVLGVAAPVGADDEFFALGGNSLLATQVVSKLRKLTGVQVKVAWFFTDPTVAGLSERIRDAIEGGHDYDSQSDAALRVLLPIRAGGALEPLFCVHPMSGMSWTFAGLAQHLPADRPIIGVQSPALSEDDYRPESALEIVRRYTDEIRAFQPEGPYHLLGYSLGGRLAHAIAAELQARGQRVRLLAVLDSYPDPDIEGFRTSLRDELGAMGVDTSDFPAEGPLTRFGDDVVAALHEVIPADLAILTPERLRRILDGTVRTVELMADYQPQVFRGDIELFRATAGDITNSPSEWAPFVTGAVADHPVDVAHQLMATAEAFAVIGPKVADLLAGVRAVPEIADPPTLVLDLAALRAEAELSQRADFGPVAEPEPDPEPEPEPSGRGPKLSVVGDVSPLPAGAMSLLEVEPSGLWVRAITLDIAAGVSGARVRRSVASLIDRHPGLWARLRRDGEAVALDIPAHPARGAAAVWQIDPAVEAVGDPIEAVIHAAAAELDPEKGYNMRFVLVEGAATNDPQDLPAAVLVVVANGLVVDDASWRTVIEDLTASWSGGHATPPSIDADPLGIARALAERALDASTVDELEWWRKTLADVTEGVSPDLVLGAADSGSRGRVSVAITGEGAAAVDAVARRYDASIDDVLLTALAATLLNPASELLRDTLGSVVRLIADGRVLGDLGGLRTVGAFSTNYPFPLRLEGLDLAEVRAGGPNAGRIIEQIRDLSREVPSQGVGFGLLRYLNPETVAEIAVLPVGRIGFRYRDLRPAEVYPEPVAADLYLDVTVDTSPDGLVARFDFVGAVLTLDQVKQLVEGWVQALAGLADHGR
ncbi:amino acid adenylation domain-containing protein [Nocardia sp. NPDC004582]